jgi:NADPH:quinone reductase-like Zn-dependent oxidoreductase
VRELGAHEVIDYAAEDFTKRDQRFDVVLDVAATSSFEAAKRVLSEFGCYLKHGADLRRRSRRPPVSAVIARFHVASGARSPSCCAMAPSYGTASPNS